MLKINSNNIEIKICSSVFQVMRKYIQLGTGSLEAGGILIGKENISDDNIIIRYITEPYASDKRRYNRFIRKDKKHIYIFNEVFNSSNEIYCYIGEWHTHNEDLPDYSRLDLKNWRKIMKESPGNIEHFHIIVGCKAIRIWRFGKLLKNPDLIKTIYWKDVMDFDKKIYR